jgi:hypothetical protein
MQSTVYSYGFINPYEMLRDLTGMQITDKLLKELKARLYVDIGPLGRKPCGFTGRYVSEEHTSSIFRALQPRRPRSTSLPP